ncbi:hypothetical protein N9M16_06400 [Candidatus Dependentiae bacterium]|nr:hypothetical protein [Candidatus Dependentiae bacterium]
MMGRTERWDPRRPAVTMRTRLSRPTCSDSRTRVEFRTPPWTCNEDGGDASGTPADDGDRCVPGPCQ